MTDDAHAKFLTKPRSRRSVLQGLGAAAIGISLSSKTVPAWAADEEPKLNFYNWDTYIGETTLPDFTEATGIDVNMSLFATNDELFAKLRAGNPGFDVIVPGSEFVQRMIQANMLDELDHAKIPNIKNVSRGVPHRRTLRSGPQIQHALYLARDGHRLSQVQGQGDPGQLEMAVRFRRL